MVHVDDQRICGRLIAVKLGRQAANLPAPTSQDGPKEAETPFPRSDYPGRVRLRWTTIPSHKMKSAQVLELYRVRWQMIRIQENEIDYGVGAVA